YTIVVGDGPVEPESCTQSTPSNAFENGHGNLHLLKVANDFTVGVNQSFTVEQVKLNVILPTGATVDAADVYFYSDTNGSGPGTEEGNSLFVIPTSVDFVGNLNTFDVNSVTLDLPSPMQLNGNATTATTYW